MTQTQHDSTLAARILTSVSDLVLEAEKATKPLEVDPYRSRLFELFVTAHGAGYVSDNSNPDLTSDGLCRELAAQWGLAEEARTSTENQTKLTPEGLSRMRLLWSVMRMWMEWDYAWDRWSEFHQHETPQDG